MGHPPKKKGRDTHTNKRTTVSCYLHVPYWYSLAELTEQDRIRNHPPLSSNNFGSAVHSCSFWLLHHNFHNQEPSKFIHHHKLFTKSYPSLEKQNDSLWFSFFSPMQRFRWENTPLAQMCRSQNTLLLSDSELRQWSCLCYSLNIGLYSGNSTRYQYTIWLWQNENINLIFFSINNVIPNNPLVQFQSHSPKIYVRAVWLKRLVIDNQVTQWNAPLALFNKGTVIFRPHTQQGPTYNKNRKVLNHSRHSSNKYMWLKCVVVVQ